MLLYVTLLGFIITFLLLINIRKSNKSNIYLFLFFLINNIYALSHYAAIYSGNKYLIAILLVHFVPIYMLAGPALYFYVRGVLTDDAHLRKFDFLHLIPAILYSVNFAGYLFSNFNHKLEFAQRVILNPIAVVRIETTFMSGDLSFLLRPVLGIIYGIVIAIMLFKHYRKLQDLWKQNVLIHKWLIFLTATVLLIYTSFLLFGILGIKFLDYSSSAQSGFYLLVSVVTGLLLLNVSLLFFPNILYGLPQLDYVINNKSNGYKYEQPNVPLEIPKRQVKSFEISEEKLNLLKYKVDRYIQNKPYLSPEFNLTIMSSDTDIPVHHLSYFFNEYMGINFNTWKNDLKIDFVIHLIQEGSGEILTLDALAKQAGFGSRTSFFNSFKQKMGVTPSDYLNSID